MYLKIFRVFYGDYAADIEKLAEMGYRISSLKPKMVLIPMNENQGFGMIEGTTKKTGTPFSLVPVCLFRRDTRQLLWETKSKSDGAYFFRNVAPGLECFVVAFDPNNEYNAVISDKVVAK